MTPPFLHEKSSYPIFHRLTARVFVPYSVLFYKSSTVVRIYSLSGEFLCEWPILYPKSPAYWKEYGNRYPHCS